MSNVFITISKLFLFLLNFLSSTNFCNKLPSKVTQKVNTTHKKERKQQKGEVKGKGQKTVCKIEKGKEQNVSKAKGKRAKGQKTI